SLRGEIQPKVWATPAELQLPADDESKSAQLLRVESIVPGLLGTFQNVTTNRGNVTVELQEKTSDALVFRVTVAGSAPWGTFYDLFYVTFDHPERRSLNVRVQARKGHPLVVIPAT